MFDLGFQELIVIFAVAIMVFGPKKLPELSRNLGKGVAQLRKALFDVKYEINKEMRVMDEDGPDPVMEEIPKWKKDAMDAIYGGKSPVAGGPINNTTADEPAAEAAHKDTDTSGSDGSKEKEA